MFNFSLQPNYFYENIVTGFSILHQNFTYENIVYGITVIALLITFRGHILRIPVRFREEIFLQRKTIPIRIQNKWLKGRKRIYVYVDCEKTINSDTKKEINVMKDIAEELQNLCTKYQIESINNPKELLQVPRHQSTTFAIILLLMDVSVLHCDELMREKIQNNFLEFARKGGILILGHDTLWRRTKNKKFVEAMFEVTAFEARNKKKDPSKTLSIENSDGWVHYKRNPELNLEELDLPGSKTLPKNFIMRDNEVEIVTNEDFTKKGYSGDLIKIYIEDKTGHILVAKKKYSRGWIFWINSGDSCPHNITYSQSGSESKKVLTIAQLIKYLIENKFIKIKSDDCS